MFAGVRQREADDVRRLVARYAAADYRQVKMYNELQPAWVPGMIAVARQHGPRVSGHIPNDVALSEAVEAGLQEVHHANFLLHELVPELRRLPDNVELPRHAGDVDLNSAATNALIAQVRERGVTLAPTLVAFEERWTSRMGEVPRAWQPLFTRFPMQARRSVLSFSPVAAAEVHNAVAARPELYDVHRRSFATMLELIGMLSAAGVTILPGTHSPIGFALLRDLELHVQAGIPPARVLRSATLLAARTMQLDGELGSIEPGKPADLVLVAGDPTQNISDIRRTRLVIKDGAVIDVAGLYREIGVAPDGS